MLPVRWTSAGGHLWRVEPLGDRGSADCTRGGDTSSSQWLRPWPRSNTTQPHGDRGWQGPGVREEVHGEAPAEPPPPPPPPQAAGAVYFEMDNREDDGSAPAAGRPAPLLEVLPQKGTRRHTGSGYELVLDPVVPQLGRDVTDWPPTMEFYW